MLMSCHCVGSRSHYLNKCGKAVSCFRVQVFSTVIKLKSGKPSNRYSSEILKLNFHVKSKCNILYLLGAGASANALPLVNSFTDKDGIRHKSLIEELSIMADLVKRHVGNSSFHNLCEEAKSFVTPDTFARFLFINTRYSEYRLFKFLLSAYFFYKESLYETGKPCIDKRVLSFLATICNENNLFPENVRMLNWNYDNQISIACEKFNFDNQTGTFVKNFKAFPFYKDKSQDKSQIKLVYLNGISGFTYNPASDTIVDMKSPIHGKIRDFMKTVGGLDQDSKIVQLFRNFDYSDAELLISFAWEKDSEDRHIAHFVSERISHAQAIARGTDILVVIGYSFPYFNREIDKLIFSEMPTLNKIYFQDPYRDGNYLRNQFSLSKNVEIENIEKSDHYFLPFEL
jgi:hypothetical protein